MGLLDTFLGNADQTQALSLLGANMMAGNTPQGLLAASQYMGGAKERALKAQMAQMQMEEMRSQIEQRKAAMEKAKADEEFFLQRFGPGAQSQPAMPGQLGSGSFGAVDPAAGQPAIPPVNPGGRLAGISVDELPLFKRRGMDITEAWKLANVPTSMPGGSYAMLPGQQPKYMAKFPEGMTPRADGSVGFAPNFAEEQARAAGLTAQAQERAKAESDMVTVPLPGGPRMMTRAQALQMSGGQPPAAQPTQQPFAPRQPAQQPQMDQGRAQILEQEMGKAQAQLKAALQSGDAVAAQRAATDVASLNRELGRAGGSLQTGRIQTGGIPLQNEPDAITARVTAESTAKDIAENRKAIMNAGFAAPSKIAKYEQLGKLLQGVDGGSLTATGTNLASAMNSVGIKIDKNLSNKEAAAALSNQMALELRNPANGAGMPGSMSDKDREFLVATIPNASQSAQGRKILIDSYIAVAKREQQVATFARNYEKKYGRLDNGFFEQMQAWSNQNSLFGSK